MWVLSILVLHVIVCRHVALLVPMVFSSMSNMTSANRVTFVFHQIPVLVGGSIVFRFSAPLFSVALILIFF